MERSPGAPLDVGSEIAGYRVEGLLGRGGMGVVYRAQDLALGRAVALKLLAPELAEDKGFRERFHREARLAASIDHPNVVPIYEAGEGQGRLYIAMRYVEGTDLASLLRREGTLEPSRALALTSQVAAALDAAHERGLIHRDVKPSNVLIAGEGRREHGYLADFGLTMPEGSRGSLTRSGQVLGTPDYLAPEQVTEGDAGPASDLYSLGCLMFECLTGNVPYPRGSEFAALWAHIDDPPPKASASRSELPQTLDRVFETALAKDPAKRYGSGAQLVEAARAAFPEEVPSRLSPRRRALTAGVAVLVVAAATVVGVTLATREDARSATEPTLSPEEGALQRIDPRTNELVATIPTGGRPVDVAAAERAVWVVDPDERSVLRIDAATNSVSRGGLAVGDPAAVAAGRAGVFVAADGPDGVGIAQIDPRRVDPTDEGTLRDDARIAQARLLVRPVSAVTDLAATGRGRRFTLWIADAAAGLVWRGDSGRTRPIVDAVEIGGAPLAVSARGRDLWVAQQGAVTRVDTGADGGSPAALARVRGTPVALAPAPNGVWLADYESGAVSLVDSQGETLKQASVAGRPIDLALGEGAIWVLQGDGSLIRVDPASGRTVSSIDVGGNPAALAVGAGGVWVAVSGGTPRELSRIPRRYEEVGGRGEGVEPGRSGERCGQGLPARDCVVIVSQEFAAEDGTRAFRRGTLRQKRVPGGSIECLGRTYQGVTSDVKGDAGFTRLEIEGWGTIALRIGRLVSAFDGIELRKGPICTKQRGTWAGTSEALIGAAGTYTITADRVQPLKLTLEVAD